MHVKYVDESDVLSLLLRETLLDGKLWTPLVPAKPVRLAIIITPAPCRLTIALIVVHYDSGDIRVF